MQHQQPHRLSSRASNPQDPPPPLLSVYDVEEDGLRCQPSPTDLSTTPPYPSHEEEMKEASFVQLARERGVLRKGREWLQTERVAIAALATLSMELEEGAIDIDKRRAQQPVEEPWMTLLQLTDSARNPTAQHGTSARQQPRTRTAPSRWGESTRSAAQDDTNDASPKWEGWETRTRESSPAWREGAFVDSIVHGKRSFHANHAEVSRRGQATNDGTMAPAERLTAEKFGTGVFHGNGGTVVIDEQNTVAEYKRGHRRLRMGKGKPQVADSGRDQWRTLDSDETNQVDSDVEDIRSHVRRYPEHAKRQKGATPRQYYCGSKESGSNQDFPAKDADGVRAAGKRSGNNQREMDIQSTRKLRLPFDGVPESAARYEGDSNNYCCRSPSDCMMHRESPSEYGYVLKTTSRAGRAGYRMDISKRERKRHGQNAQICNP